MIRLTPLLGPFQIHTSLSMWVLLACCWSRISLEATNLLVLGTVRLACPTSRLMVDVSEATGKHDLCSVNQTASAVRSSFLFEIYFRICERLHHNTAKFRAVICIKHENCIGSFGQVVKDRSL